MLSVLTYYIIVQYQVEYFRKVRENIIDILREKQIKICFFLNNLRNLNIG